MHLLLDTGEVYATFQSVNPLTGLPTDVLTGFLPPEDGTRRGSGYVSYIIKGHTAVRRRLVGVPMYELAISAVTEGELRYGVARLPSAARLNTMVEELLIRVAVHPWDSAAAQEYGRVRSAL